MNNNGDWDENRKYVLKSIENTNGCIKDIKKGIVEIKIDLKGLKVKSGIWGAIGGALVVIIPICVAIISGIIKAKIG